MYQSVRSTDLDVICHFLGSVISPGTIELLYALVDLSSVECSLFNGLFGHSIKFIREELSLKHLCYTTEILAVQFIGMVLFVEDHTGIIQLDHSFRK